MAVGLYAHDEALGTWIDADKDNAEFWVGYLILFSHDACKDSLK